MRPIHKRSDGGFLRAVAIVLFLAVCAYSAAALYACLTPRALPAVSETMAAVPRLSGLVLRREEALSLPASAVLAVRDGERVPAGGVLARLTDGTELRAPASALFFSACDGLERLSADDSTLLNVSTLTSLLEEAPERPEACAGRLVYDSVWYFAALAPTETAPSSPGPCRLRFSGHAEWLSARLLCVSEAEEGQRALLFRLSRGGEYLSLRRTEADLYAADLSAHT